MGIYQENLTAIVIRDNSLPIIAIALIVYYRKINILNIYRIIVKQIS